MTMTPEQKREPRPVVIPTVPHGVEYLPVDQADAGYYRSAAANIRAHKQRGLKFSGSNVTEAIARLCEAAADALEATPVTPDENVVSLEEVISPRALDHWRWQEKRRAQYKDRGCVCELCESVPLIMAALSRTAVPDTTEPEWEYAIDQAGRIFMLSGTDYDSMEAWLKNAPLDSDEKIMHRFVGPWLPVPEKGER